MKRILLLFCATLFSFSLHCQVQWTKHDGNPVLKKGPDGDWDAIGVGFPCVIFKDGTYHMWYGGFSETSLNIGYATSDDGINWTKLKGNPVLEVGAPGSWDDGRVYIPSVIYDEGDSIFHMWYAGGSGSSESHGYASSPDGIHWTKHPSNPINGGGGAMLFQDNSYHSWYNHFGLGGTMLVNYSISEDCCSWTRVAKDVLSPEYDKWDYPRVQASSVLNDGDTLRMWYSGGAFYEWRIGYASSTDGIIWTRYQDDPVLDVDTADSWDKTYVAFGSVLFDSVRSVYKMWYYGGKNAYEGNIGYAEWHVLTNASKKHFSGQTRIYPNPAGDLINVHSDKSGEFYIEITSANGQLIQSAIMEGAAIRMDLSSFQKGIYFITLRSRDQVWTEKIIKL